jgi:cytoskeletal protein RodZ
MVNILTAIQNQINTIFKKKGIITESEFNELDEKAKELKLKTLESESRSTILKYGVLIVGIIGTIWFFNKKKANE